MSFAEAVKNVQKGGKYSKEQAAAIVANASRKASPAAKRKNPNLLKVSGSGKKRVKGKAKK